MCATIRDGHYPPARRPAEEEILQQQHQQQAEDRALMEDPSQSFQSVFGKMAHRRKELFLLMTRALLRYLSFTDANLHQQAKKVIYQCVRRYLDGQRRFSRCQQHIHEKPWRIDRDPQKPSVDDECQRLDLTDHSVPAYSLLDDTQQSLLALVGPYHWQQANTCLLLQYRQHQDQQHALVQQQALPPPQPLPFPMRRQPLVRVVSFDCEEDCVLGLLHLMRCDQKTPSTHTTSGSIPQREFTYPRVVSSDTTTPATSGST